MLTDADAPSQYDDAHESSYICFRRRDAKPVRRTRASSTAYTDKLTRLRTELQIGLELANTVLEREKIKNDAAGSAQEVWQARCALVEVWKNEEGAKGVGMGVDEALLFDRERIVKPKPPKVPFTCVTYSFLTCLPPFTR
jgi:enhancer of polycomb-like protein